MLSDNLNENQDLTTATSDNTSDQTAQQRALEAYETASQANTFGLLARMWVSELDQPMIDELQDEPLGPAYEAAGGVIPKATDPDFSLLDSLAIEYCGCFLGPKNHLPPHQSVVAHSRFQGDCLDSMKKYVDVIGQPEGLFAEQKMLDHAGVQLHLMQRVLASLAETIEDQTAPASTRESLEQLRDAFYVEHLAWLIDYCKVAQAKSRSEFYGGLFRVTGMLLGE